MKSKNLLFFTKTLLATAGFLGLVFFVQVEPACATACGNPLFTTSTLASSYAVNTVKTADMDGDGDYDVIAGSSAAAGDLFIFYNNGSGSFTTLTVTSTLESQYSIAIADFNLDGRQDILVGDRYGEKLYWYENVSNTSYTERSIATGLTTDSVYGVATGDLDGDGDKDAIVTISGTADDVAYYKYSTSTNSFGTIQYIDSNFPGAFDVTSGDLDSDGDIDVAAVSGEVSGGISYYLNNGSGTFTETSLSTSPRQEVTIGDLDGDGDNDLVVGAQNALYWYAQSGGAISASATTISGTVSSLTALHIFDVDGDTDKDLVTSDGGSSLGNISYWQNNGSQTFTRKNAASTTLAYDVHAADLTGDGSLDMVAALQNSHNKVMLLTQACDSTAPTLSSVFPADNATGVTTTANLVMNFAEAVTASTTGYISIYNSDGTMFERMNATSSTITGSGNASITINPAGTFVSQASYYVMVSSTVFADASGNTYAGISSATTWNFTAIDETAPTISSVTSTPATTSAVITWTTDEISSSKVFFGPTTTAYGRATTESDTDTRVTSHSVTLSDLPSCSTFHYVVISRDTLLNSATSTSDNFSTTGCAGSSGVVTSTNRTIGITAGTSLSLLEDTYGITLTVPNSYASTSADFQIKELSPSTVVASTGRPSGYVEATDYTYNLTAITHLSYAITTFDVALSITMSYSDNTISGLVESGLTIFRWDGSSWTALSNCSVNSSSNTVTCETTNFSTFGLFGTQPVATSDTSTNTNNGGSAPIFPKAVGLGVIEKTIEMYRSGNLGKILPSGINYLSYIKANAEFTLQTSTANTAKTFQLITDELNLITKKITLKIAPNILNKTIALHEQILVDMDEDLIPDLSLTFTNLWINRAELTLRSIVNTPPNAEVITKEAAILNNSPTITVIENQSELPNNCEEIIHKKFTIGTNKTEVSTLQICLNSLGFTVAKSGPGSKGQETSFFGPLTKIAQNKYLIRTTPAHKESVIPIGSSPYIFTRDLEKGIFHADIIALQTYLNSLGFTVAKSGPGSKGQETSFFGPGTETALKQFQTKNGLSATGYFGELTRKKLNLQNSQ